MTKPTEIEALTVFENSAGAKLQVVPTPTAEEARLAELVAHTYSGDEILNIEPRKWLVKNWLPLNSFIVAYSAPGVGKSFYGLALALEAASGGRWCGTRLPRPLTVLYVAAERRTDQRDRAEAWSVHNGKPIPKTFRLVAEPYGAELTNPVDVTALCLQIEKYGADIVVLDTYAAMTAGLDENASQETTKIMRNAVTRLVQATNGGIVIALHHVTKNATGLNALRGSGALGGHLDIAIELSVISGQIKAHIRKSNAGLDNLSEFYTLEPVALPPAKGEHEKRQLAVLTYTGAPVPIGDDYDEIVQAVEAIGGRSSCADITTYLKANTDSTQKTNTVGKKLTALVKQGRIVKHGAASNTTYSAVQDTLGDC